MSEFDLSRLEEIRTRLAWYGGGNQLHGHASTEACDTECDLRWLISQIDQGAFVECPSCSIEGPNCLSATDRAELNRALLETRPMLGPINKIRFYQPFKPKGSAKS